MLQNLVLISSIPFGGMNQVRIHYLLESVRYVHPKYDATELMSFIDRIVKLGLKPGFEVMGNPGNRFTNFSDNGNLTEWFNLVTSVVDQLQRRYGENEVEFWNFESWNEPGSV